jgi:hypothetical protein
VTRRRRPLHRRIALTLASGGIALIGVGALSSAASAGAPQRVGWWNSASTSGVPTGQPPPPSPTTPAGGIRVASGPTSSTAPTGLLPGQVPPPQGEVILAYGAVLYGVPEGSSGTLKLSIAGNPQGTPQVVACPTSNTTWAGGDDQPSSSEPAYDCTNQHYSGTVSADGTTITFKVSALFEATRDLLSLAIVPDLTSTAAPGGGVSPFAVDFNPPDASSFSPAQTLTSPPGVILPGPSAGEVPSSAPFTLPAPASLGQPIGLPAVTLPTPAAAASPAPVAAVVAPQATPPATTAPAAVTPMSAASETSPKARFATALGSAGLVAAVLVWSLGYGVLGGRIIPLSVPLKRG